MQFAAAEGIAAGDVRHGGAGGREQHRIDLVEIVVVGLEDLRERLAEVALARGQRQGQASKTEILYDYLTGPQFRARVEAVVERFEMLREDLERERKTMMTLWAKREKSLGIARDAMVGMYGDVQGIAGSSVPDIEGLEEPPLLED